MKAFVVLAVLIGATYGAPTENIEGTKREAAINFGDKRVLRESSNLEELQQQRSYYDGIPAVAVSGPSAAAAAINAAAAAASSAAAASAASPAVGVFPGAKIGGCAIPLLLSCAPSVHSGHLSSSYAAPAYRTDAEHKMRAAERQWAPAQAELEPAMQWFESQRALETAEMPNHHHNHHHHLIALDVHPKMTH